jgi:hypothetical protein
LSSFPNPIQSPGTHQRTKDMSEQTLAAPAAFEPSFPAPLSDPTVDPWMQVEEACATALTLSHEVRHQVDDGVDAHNLVPLLHRQREAVAQLQSALGTLVSMPHPDQGARRDHLGQQLRELLNLHDTSIDTLSTRGVRLSGGRIR